MFRNPDHALRWAYTTVAKPLVKQSSVYMMRQQSSHAGLQNELLIGMSARDRQMQAAEILGMVARLSDPGAAEYVGAYFGYRIDEEDIKILIWRCCAALGLTMQAKAQVYLILRAYFGGKVPYRTVRRILGCRDQYALLVRSCLYDTLEHIHDRALADLHEVFEQHGLIRSSVQV